MKILRVERSNTLGTLFINITDDVIFINECPVLEKINVRYKNGETETYDGTLKNATII